LITRRSFEICSVGAFALAWAGCAAASTGAADSGAKAKAVHVDSVVVVEREMPNALLLAGTLKPNQEAEVAANATGRVLRTMVERGSYVSAGAAIAQLDTRMATLNAKEAEANAQTALTQKANTDRDCARYDDLLQRGAISQQEYQRQATLCKTAVTSTAATETRVAMMKQTLADGTIRAPFAGLVSERYVSVGEYVTPSTKVAHIVDIDPLRLELTIPEQNMSAVKQGLIVEFQVSAFPKETFKGTVHYIGPAVRASTRDLVFEAMVPNKDKRLRPGLFAEAHLDVGTQKLPIVPKTALRQDGDTTRAFVIVGKHIEERLVQTGPADESSVAILKGLVAGERIADHPSERLADGVEVE
jgi:membrane fusion protein (multidrug efflux system)